METFGNLTGDEELITGQSLDSHWQGWDPVCVDRPGLLGEEGQSKAGRLPDIVFEAPW